MVWFFVGLFIGAFFGVLIIGLLVAAKGGQS